MSIKSEKAREILAENVNPITASMAILHGGDLGKCDITLRSAKQAIIQAESDAEQRCRAEDRERAVRAFCVLCRNEGGCPDIHHMTGQEMLNCNYVNDFLKHYDQ